MLPAPLLGIKGMIELGGVPRQDVCPHRRVADSALRAMPGLSD